MVTGARPRGRGGCERPDRGDHPARAGVATPGKSRVALADGDASCPEVEPSGAPLCTVKLCPCATPRSDRAAVGSHRSLTALGRSRDCESNLGDPCAGECSRPRHRPRCLRPNGYLCLHHRSGPQPHLRARLVSRPVPSNRSGAAPTPRERCRASRRPVSCLCSGAVAQRRAATSRGSRCSAA